MGSTPLEYCWFIYKIGARTGRLTGQFETYALSFVLVPLEPQETPFGYVRHLRFLLSLFIICLHILAPPCWG